MNSIHDNKVAGIADTLDNYTKPVLEVAIYYNGSALLSVTGTVSGNASSFQIECFCNSIPAAQLSVQGEIFIASDIFSTSIISLMGSDTVPFTNFVVSGGLVDVAVCQLVTCTAIDAIEKTTSVFSDPIAVTIEQSAAPATTAALLSTTNNVATTSTTSDVSTTSGAIESVTTAATHPATTEAHRITIPPLQLTTEEAATTSETNTTSEIDGSPPGIFGNLDNKLSKHKSNTVGIAVGVAIPLGVLIIAAIIAFIILRRKNKVKQEEKKTTKRIHRLERNRSMQQMDTPLELQEMNREKYVFHKN